MTDALETWHLDAKFKQFQISKYHRRLKPVFVTNNFPWAPTKGHTPSPPLATYPAGPTLPRT
jgi:hypothetical protein